jgi:hypothetical protein
MVDSGYHLREKTMRRKVPELVLLAPTNHRAVDTNSATELAHGDIDERALGRRPLLEHWLAEAREPPAA